MQAFEGLRKAYWSWLDRAADVVIAAIIRVRAVRTVSLIEGEDGRLAIVAPVKNAPQDGALWLQEAMSKAIPRSTARLC